MFLQPSKIDSSIKQEYFKERTICSDPDWSKERRNEYSSNVEECLSGSSEAKIFSISSTVTRISSVHSTVTI